MLIPRVSKNYLWKNGYLLYSLFRLVSSGEYDNSVTVLVKAATDADLDFDSNLVMACPEFMGAAWMLNQK